MAYSIPHILQCYAQGYFLMADSDYQTLNWYSSRKRALIPLDNRFRYPKSLRRVLNQNRFEIAFNRDFNGVIEGCADRKTTWISDELKAIYRMLHRAGYAHSFETWQGDRLAGGIASPRPFSSHRPRPPSAGRLPGSCPGASVYRRVDVFYDSRWV